jgi:hypothetical protein
LADERGADDAFEHWKQVIDGAPYGCWYRLRDNGQIELWARGHHVTVPLEALALLPEAVARAVIAKLVEGKTQAAVEAYQSSVEDPPMEQLFIDLNLDEEASPDVRT